MSVVKYHKYVWDGLWSINELNGLWQSKQNTWTTVDETIEMNFSIGFFMNKIEVTRPTLIPKFKIVFGNTLLKELEKTIKRRTTDTF